MPERTPLEGLATIAALLGEVGVSYALVGGLAVSVRGEVRFTRDIDLVVDQDHTGRMGTVRLTSEDGLIADLLFASTGIEADIVAGATPVEVPIAGRVMVASLEHLVAMKVLSESGDRPQDRIDLRGLLAQEPDLARVRTLLDAITAASCHRGQDLRTKLAGWVETGG